MKDPPSKQATVYGERGEVSADANWSGEKMEEVEAEKEEEKEEEEKE